jgi:phosphonate transport system substrate-binding protein
MVMKLRRLLIFLSFLVLLISNVNAQEKVLTFGIVPQQAPTQLAKLWGPVLQELSQLSGYQLVFQTAPDIPTFEKRLMDQQYDIAYMNPYHYVFFHEHAGYQAIARERDNRIKGIIVVPVSSELQTLNDLQELDIAFPSPAAFAASVLPQAELKRAGIKFTPKYVSSHDSVYRAVAKQIYPAGGGIVRTYNNMVPEIRGQLRILWTTQSYTPHAFAVNAKLDENTKKQIQSALINMNDSEEKRQLIAVLGFKSLEIAKNEDWDDVRGLEIDLLDTLLH